VHQPTVCFSSAADEVHSSRSGCVSLEGRVLEGGEASGVDGDVVEGERIEGDEGEGGEVGVRERWLLLLLLLLLRDELWVGEGVELLVVRVGWVGY